MSKHYPPLFAALPVGTKMPFVFVLFILLAVLLTGKLFARAPGISFAGFQTYTVFVLLAAVIFSKLYMIEKKYTYKWVFFQWINMHFFDKKLCLLF